MLSVSIALDEQTGEGHLLKEGLRGIAEEFAGKLLDALLISNPDPNPYGRVTVTQPMREAAQQAVQSGDVSFVIRDPDWERLLVFRDGSALAIDTYLDGLGVGGFSYVCKLPAYVPLRKDAFGDYVLGEDTEWRNDGTQA
jgi:hypothetical protein